MTEKHGILLNVIVNGYAATVSVVVNKIILWLIATVAFTSTRKWGVNKKVFQARTPSHAKYFPNVFFILLNIVFFSFIPVPGHPLERNPLIPIPKIWEWICIPPRSQTFGV